MTVRLGLCTSCFENVSLPEVLRWAGESGYQSVEIDCPPLRGASTWYQHAALNIAGLDGPARDAFLASLEKVGLRAAALACDANLLDADPARRDASLEHLRRLVEIAGTLGIETVVILAGRDPASTLGDSIAEFARRMKPIAERAEAAGVQLAIDTCPRIGWQIEDMPGNVAFCPEMWEKLFTHLRSPAVGLALNPADLAWQGIDPLAATTDYIEKVFHLRAQDVEMLDLRRQDCGVLRPGGGWWRYRAPGLGSIDWRRFIDRLHELRYAGDLVVKHADPVWQGDLERLKTGLALARRHLVQFLP